MTAAKSKTLVEHFVENEENRRAFLQERAIRGITDLIDETMRAKGVTRKDLAKKLNKTAGWVTQLLDGDRNKTIRTMADVLAVLGMELEFKAREFRVGVSTELSSNDQPRTTAARKRLNAERRQ